MYQYIQQLGRLYVPVYTAAREAVCTNIHSSEGGRMYQYTQRLGRLYVPVYTAAGEAVCTSIHSG